MLFSQSRALHRALRNFYREDLSLNVAVSTNSRLNGSRNNVDQQPAASPLAFDDQRVAMIFIADHFHRQVFDALETNPLSALLSLAWTICSTSFNVSPESDETAYLRVWSPFICLVNALSQLNEKIGSKAVVAKDESNVSERSARSGQLFDLDDLRVSDRAFIKRIEQLTKMNKDQRKVVTYEQANSELFVKLMERTPFGTYQINDFSGSTMKDTQRAARSHEDREWIIGKKIYTYVLSPVNVQDRERFLALFTRHETNEKLRRQVESILRENFAAYHSRYSIDVTPWLVATHEIDENGIRASIWQMQKSALVWILYHSLAAVVTVNANPVLMNDFVATVRCIDNFIECGLCLRHWNDHNRKNWDKRTQTYTRDKRTTSLFAAYSDSPDLALLVTHNDIQASIDPRLKLTDAAVYALREDYLNFARAIVLALSNKSLINPTSVTPVAVNTSVHQHDANRKDVCRQPYELWSTQLERMNVLQNADLSTRGYVKDSLLKLQWDKLRNE